MRKILVLLTLLTSLQTFSQGIQIPALPTYVGNLDGGAWLITSINNATRKVDVGYVNKGRLDSIVAALGGYALTVNHYTKAQADLRFLQSFTELDPLVSSAIKAITSGQITNWDASVSKANSAFGWGNHATAGYLTSYSETDPVFLAHVAASITSTNISNWGTAYSKRPVSVAITGNATKTFILTLGDGSTVQGTFNDETGSAGGGITTLNTLTSSTQSFATGTSGTNFNISSSGSTHTFNIPDGSASNRGLITSTDWSTFNNKQPAGDYATNTALTSHTSNTSNPHSVTKAQVGLSNVDNTSDANKPVSTAQATAIALKQDAATAVTLTGTQTLTNKTLTSPVINSPTGITKSDVGLSNVDNTSDANKPISTATQTALNAKQATISLTTTGSSGAATFNGTTLNIPQYTGGSGTATIAEEYDIVVTGTGVDNTATIKSALASNLRILFRGASITNDTLQIGSDRYITFEKGASLKIGSSPSTKLSTSGFVFYIANRSNITINNLYIPYYSGTLTLNEWLAGYVRIEGSTNVKLINPKMEYNGNQVKCATCSDSSAFQGIVVRGESKYTYIEKPDLFGAGLTYSESGADYTTVKGGLIKGVKGNAMNGIGNDGDPGEIVAEGNLIEDVTIDSVGRMGIEDQQAIDGTRILNCRITRTGRMPITGEGMGISAVGTNSLMQGNYINDYYYLGIEMFGNGGNKAINNTIIRPTRVEEDATGIMLNFDHSDVELAQGAEAKNNTIINATKGIDLYGGYLPMAQITGNTIIDPVVNGIQVSLNNSVTGSVVINTNTVDYTLPALNLSGDYQRSFYINNSVTLTGATPISLLNNTVRYRTSSNNGLSYLEGFSVYANNVTMVSNVVEGNSVVGQSSVAVSAYLNTSTATGMVYQFNRHSGSNASISGTLAYAQNNTFTGGTELGGYSSGGGGGSGTVSSGTANRLAYYPSTSTTVDDLAAITANRAIVSNASGLPTHSATTDTEIGYVSGVTSSIQTQLGTKAPTASPTFTGTVVLPSTTSIGNVTNTEIGYLDGVTSAIQTQVDAKAPLASPTFTGTVTLPSATSIGNVTSTEVGYLDGVTSNIQTQINSLTGGGTPDPWTHVFLTSDEDRTSSTTLTNSANFTFSMAASTKYKIEFDLILELPNAVGMKFALTGPASPTEVRIARQHLTASSGASIVAPAVETSYTPSTNLSGAATSGGWMKITMIVSNGVNAGTFAFQWAQITSSATATKLKFGSEMRYKTL